MKRSVSCTLCCLLLVQFLKDRLRLLEAELQVEKGQRRKVRPVVGEGRGKLHACRWRRTNAERCVL